MKFIAIIPARYASSRFPGKPLVDIKGKPMIQHVYERCQSVFENVAVATDDKRIVLAVREFGGNVVVTSDKHTSGTDRVAEAADKLSKEFQFDVVVNVQGDEPFIESNQLEQIKKCFEQESTDIATLITPIKKASILFDPNKVKAVKGVNNYALYFSRQALPYFRDEVQQEWVNRHDYFLHLGLYAYRTSVLNEITKLKPTPLEEIEKLEQLRWLENGYRIKTAETKHASFGVDTPEDLELLLRNI